MRVYFERSKRLFGKEERASFDWFLTVSVLTCVMWFILGRG